MKREHDALRWIANNGCSCRDSLHDPCAATCSANVAGAALDRAPTPAAVPEKRCQCGHLPTEHNPRYTTPYPCVPGQACLCGFVRTPGEETTK